MMDLLQASWGSGLMGLPDNLFLGTSSWSSADWVGPFYSASLQPSQFLQAYARRFRAVEIDATFYGVPAPSMVRGWREKTPPGFMFAARVPRVITHEKVLRDCQTEFTAFLSNMALLGDHLGPLLLQFPYFNRSVFASREPFEKLLRAFLKTLPRDFRFALEIRNKNWISWDFLELLREHSVAFSLIAQAWMPRIDTLARALDLVTADFCYARFIGERKSLEGQTKKWDKISEDKSDEMRVWVAELRKFTGKGVRTYVFFNNQYAGFAPGSAKLFESLWVEANEAHEFAVSQTIKSL
jgi:uncharacterized protein YecE (DUF72 family)